MKMPATPNLKSLIFQNYKGSTPVTCWDISNKVLPDLEWLSSQIIKKSGVTTGTYGSSTSVPKITIDETGRITAASMVDINFPEDYISSVSNTSTISLSVIGGELKAELASMDISQFTNDTGYAVLNSISPYLVPAGSIQMWGSDSAPSNWLLCNGASVLRSEYAALFAIVGTTFGSADGTHFNVPDFRSKFPFGKAAAGTGNTLGGTFGAIDHTHTADPPSTDTSSNGAHTHTVTVPSENATVLLNLGQVGADGAYTTSSNGAHTHSVDIASFNTGTNNPPALTINFIIKT